MKVQIQLIEDKEIFKVCVNGEEGLEQLFYEFASQLLAYKRNKNKKVQGDIEK